MSASKLTESATPWPTVRLGELAESNDAFADGPFGSNLKSDTYSDSGARVIRLRNVGRGEFAPDDAAFIPLDHFERLARHHVRPGDVVVAALGDGARPAGRACLVPDNLGPALVKADCFRVRLPGTRIDTAYLVLYLNSPEALADISGAMRGATRPRVNLSILRNLSIPLPPLPEQERIVAKLRQQLDAAARMRAAAERQEAYAREVAGVAADRTFRALAADWSRRPIGQMARIVSGYAFKSAWFAERGVRLLRNANVSQGNIDWTDTVRLPEDTRSEFAECELSVGDIVLALDRPLVAAGLKVARLARSDVPSLLLQRVATFRLSDDLDAGYLYAFLRTSAFVDAIKGHEQSLGVPHISPKQVAAVVLPVPPIDYQRDIVGALDDELGSVASVVTAVGDQAAEISRLPAALLRRAFSGGT